MRRAEREALAAMPPWHRGFNCASDLRILRSRAGLSQSALAALSNCERHAVIYHEKKAGRVDGPVPVRFRKIIESLGHKVPGWREPPLVAQQRETAPPIGTTCGAMTRKGTICQCKPLKTGGRCKYHGGMSTGPKTPEGKARIIAARRVRAERERALPTIPMLGTATSTHAHAI